MPSSKLAEHARRPVRGVCYAAIALLFVIGALIGALYPHLKAWLTGDVGGQPIVLRTDSACDPATTRCTVREKGLAIQLRFEGEVRALRIFKAEVALLGVGAITADRVSVRFTMADMDMGFNRFGLRRDPDGFWRGEIMLPVCSTGRMDWLATVEVDGDQPHAGKFPLTLHP